jgi:tRNA A37 threonylcarbamoyladenosine dehydratase
LIQPKILPVSQTSSFERILDFLHSMDDWAQRFGGIGRLYGAAGLARLQSAHVCVVGVGGVGSWIIEALARCGVGQLSMMDLDDICITNMNRQLPALTHTVGQPKVRVLTERVREICPTTVVHQRLEFLSEAKARQQLDHAYSYVVDAVDRMSVKAAIIQACAELKVPVLTCGSAGGRRDPTQIRVTDLGLAGHDPLLQQTRRKLRKDHGWPRATDGKALRMAIPCVYSTESPIYPWADGSCSLQPEPGQEVGLRLDCSAGFGAATFVTGAFGFAAAAEVVRQIALA